MTDRPDLIDPRSEATRAQALASDPAASVFVSANAGTGKTKLLTDRVLRLLLAGAKADGILCVTYTRAAAAEMRNRIAARLADWAIISTAKLIEDLGSMGVSQPSQIVIQTARRLFAETLDNDNGPRVETVHSFCQSILRRFPIEAGIAPNAGLADDAEQFRLKAMARDMVLRGSDLEVNAAVQMLAEHTSEDNLNDILNDFVRRGKHLDAPDLLGNVRAQFQGGSGVGTAGDVQEALADLLGQINSEGIRAVAAVLGKSGVKNHITRAGKMDMWLALDNGGRAQRINLLIDALFTDGRPRAASTLSNKKIRDELESVLDIQQKTQTLLAPWQAKLAVHRCRELTEALYCYGAAYYRQYHALKMARGLLDYDDLIVVTNNLMARSEAAQWVAWKLDNGISHLLIDEAQDTSPAQWALLRRLSEEFFQTSPEATVEDMQRTIFAVGDFKQSIYSFQGADPAVMSANRESIAAEARMRGIDFRALSLSVSFRSTGPVLDLVNSVIPALDGIEDFTPHRLERSSDGGFVELWPLVESDEKTEETPGFTPPPVATSTDAGAKAARHLAATIKSWIGTRKLSSGQMMKAGDVIILLSKRDRFFAQIMAALQDQSIPIAGADRMKLEEQIEIQDLLALGDVVLLPEDDLQLATLLKSPLFGMGEEQLFALAHGRDKATLHSRLMHHAGANSDLGRMADQLIQWRNIADQKSVFAFYSDILINGGRARLQARLGPAVRESLDHFLNLAQNSGHMSLTEFVLAMRGVGGEVKRDLDSGDADEVRVMTIHGAKGLEAPVVFLPDMLVSRTKFDPLITDADTGIVYFNPGSGFRVEFLDRAKENHKKQRQAEANRLLYVALTRARDGLVIGGWKSNARSTKDANYYRIRSAMEGISGHQETEDGGLEMVKIGVDAPELEGRKGQAPALPKPVDTDTGWLFKNAPKDPDFGRPFRPSQPGSDFIPQPIGRAAGSADDYAAGMAGRSMALAKGNFAHRLFEILPALPADLRADSAKRIAQTQPDIDPKIGQQIIDDVMNVMANEKFARLFGDDALAEVSVNGMVAGVGVAGQIDRFHIGTDDIVMADFKTGAKPAGVPPQNYTLQMALYAKLLQDIYPDKPVISWLIWTEAATLQEIVPVEREQALEAFLVRQEKGL